MIFSGYIIKFPYWITWHITRFFHKEKELTFYVGSVHDYYLIENILPHIKYPYRVVAKNKKIAKTLHNKGIKTIVWPTFPKIVVMPRHAFHKFPIKAIKKIGMRHGPYHFKKMIDAAKYNAFDLFLFTSEHEVRQAKNKGILNGVPGGYPRLDIFKNLSTHTLSKRIKETPFFDSQNTTLLFTATWKQSGLSAIDRWLNHIEKLTSKYNIIVSLHPMMPEKFKDQITNLRQVKLTTPAELPACMLAADFLISDTSSVIAEFCALNKPIITFKVDLKERLTHEIAEMIQEISIQITSLEEIDAAIEKYKTNPNLKKEARTTWNKRFFDEVSVSHGLKAASHIHSFVSENKA